MGKPTRRWLSIATVDYWRIFSGMIKTGENWKSHWFFSYQFGFSASEMGTANQGISKRKMGNPCGKHCGFAGVQGTCVDTCPRRLSATAFHSISQHFTAFHSISQHFTVHFGLCINLFPLFFPFCWHPSPNRIEASDLRSINPINLLENKRSSQMIPNYPGVHIKTDLLPVHMR